MKFLPQKRTCVGKQDCRYRSEQSGNGSNTGGERDPYLNIVTFLICISMVGINLLTYWQVLSC